MLFLIKPCQAGLIGRFCSPPVPGVAGRPPLGCLRGDGMATATGKGSGMLGMISTMWYEALGGWWIGGGGTEVQEKDTAVSGWYVERTSKVEGAQPGGEAGHGGVLLTK